MDENTMDQTAETPARPQIEPPTVELGGRLWELRFGHKAMRMFCRAAKCTLSDLEKALDTYDNEIALLWCIVSTQDPAVKREELEDWLDDMLLEDLFSLVQDCFAAALPNTYGRRLQKARAALAAEDEANPTTGAPAGTSATA